MNVKQFNLAIAAFVQGSNNLVVTLRKAAVDAGFTTWEDCRPVVLSFVSQKYSVPTVESKSPRNKGQMVLDSTHAAYAAARKAFQRLEEALCADADAAPKERANKGEEFEVPAHIAALAAKLVAACNEYEAARKIAAKAVAEAFKA